MKTLIGYDCHEFRISDIPGKPIRYGLNSKKKLTKSLNPLVSYRNCWSKN